jgi:hypothetical protein
VTPVLALNAVGGVIVGALIAAAAGVLTALLGLVSAADSTTAAQETAAADRKHQLKLDRQGRLYERRADAYVDLLTQRRRSLATADAFHPVYAPGREIPEVTAPDPEVFRHVMSRLAAFGSARVRTALADPWTTSSDAFIDAARAFTSAQRHGTDDADLRRAMDYAREALRAALDVVDSTIAAELGARPRPAGDGP